jgi:hypothetical protein
MSHGIRAFSHRKHKDNQESTKTRSLFSESFFRAFMSPRAFVIILLFWFWVVQVRTYQKLKGRMRQGGEDGWSLIYR